MTPAERDMIRALAASKLRVCSGSECGVECRAHRANLRYVPAGDATAPSPWSVRPDDCGLVAISHPDVVAALEPDAARRLALALLAAADAAEEK